MRTGLIRVGIVCLSLGIIACDNNQPSNPAPDGSSCPTPLCSGVCCGDGESCQNGVCGPCQPETEVELCARLGKTCGALSADDNCGKARTVESCGECQAPEVCNAQTGTCTSDCPSETDAEFCRRIGKECGAADGPDNCGKPRHVDDCGSCPSGQTCEANACVEPCQDKETDAQFCKRLEKNCGNFAGTNLCNKPRTADCGQCGQHEACDAASNRCYSLCEDDAAFCRNRQAVCGSLNATDNCDQVRTVDCGPCPEGQDCDGLNSCVSCIPEGDTAFCARLGKNCGEVAGTDNCGGARTVASCGSCTGSEVCQPGNFCDVPGAPPNNKCAAPERIVFDADGRFTTRGDTTKATNNSESSCNTASGNDVVYVMALAEARTVEIAVTPEAGSGLKSNVFVLQRCGDKSSQVFGACKSVSSVVPNGLLLKNLAAGTYFVWVDGWGTNTNGPFTLAVTATDPALGPPPNDTCLLPEPLAFDAGGVARASGSTIGATNASTGSCETMNGADIVYSLHLDSPSAIDVKVIAPAFPAAVYLRSACGDTASEKICAKAANGVASGHLPVLAEGDYYLFVDGTAGGAGTFNLEVKKSEALLHDECTGAKKLTFAGDVAVVQDDTTGATNSGDGICNVSSGRDLVYSFTTSSVKNVEVEVTPVSNTLRPNVYLRSSCGQKSSELACDSATVNGSKVVVRAVRLPASTYYVWVDGFTSSSAGEFSLKVTVTDADPVIGSDTCTGAEPLTFGADGKVTVTGSTAEASNLYAGLCATADLPHSGPDRVYSFTLDDPARVTAKVSRGANSGLFKPAVYLRTACESDAKDDQAACANESSGTATADALNLPRGTYYVFVDGLVGTFGDYSLELTQTPSVVLPDTCPEAQLVDLSSGSATISADTTLATNATQSLILKKGSGHDLVYKLELTDPVEFTATMKFASSLNYAVLYLRKVCDASSVTDELLAAPSGTNSATATISQKKLPAGTYYLWVDGVYPGDNGAFTLTITAPKLPKPPANDTCPTAKTLTLVGGSATETGNTATAMDDYAGGCNTTMPGGDVVYRLDIPGPDHASVTAKVTRDPAATSFQPAVYIRSSNCGSAAPADQLACAKYTTTAPAPSAVVYDLAPGSYYVIVDSLTAQGGAFTLDVTAGPARVYPDTCATAQDLSLRSGKASVSDDITDAKNDSNSLKCTPSDSGADLVYRLDTRGLGVKNLVATLTYTAPGNKVYPAMHLQTVCGTSNPAEEIACAKRSSEGPLTMTRGSLPEGVYYLWVDTAYASDKGPFTLDVELVEPARNDVCGSGVVPLAFLGDTAFVSGTTVGAANDYTGTCGTMSGADLVYAFELSGPRSVTAKVTSRTSGYEPAVYLRAICDSASPADQPACAINSGGVAVATVPTLPGGLYEVFVDGMTATPGDFDLEILQGPASDFPNTCATAMPVRLDASGKAMLQGDTLLATNDFASPVCTGATGKDLVYRIDTTALGTRDLLAKVTFVSGSVYPALYLKTDCQGATSASEVTCVRGTTNTASLSTYSLSPAVYYLVVDTTNPSAQGVFTLDLQVTPPPGAPANDTCASATPLVFNNSQAIEVATTRGGSNDYTGTCGTMDGPDAVYELNLANDAMVTAKVTRDPGSPTYNPAVHIRTGCSSAAPGEEKACGTQSGGVATAAVAWLPAGRHHVFVDGTGGSFGKYTLEVTLAAPLRGDVCADAIPLAFDPVSGQARVSGDNTRASNVGSGSCGGASGTDLVYTFELKSPARVDLTVAPDAGSALQPTVYLRTACGVQGSEFPALDGSGGKSCKYTSTAGAAVSHSFPKLAAGNYYVWVDGYSGAKGPFTLTATASTVPPPPSNDVCARAEPLSFDGSGKATVLMADTTFATNLTSGACDVTSDAPELFYQFTLGQPASVTAKVTRDSSSNNFNPLVYIRSSCAVADEKACAVGSSGTVTASVNMLPAGTHYVVVDGQGATYGKFKLEVTTGTALRGDSCADPVELSFDGSGVAQADGDNTTATNATAGSCYGGVGMDLVYRFSLSSAKKVDLLVTPNGGSLQPVVYLRTTCDQTATEYGCNSAGSAGGTAKLSFQTLAAGTYYVWVDNVLPANKGPFTLKVTAVDPPAPPANDTCRTAEELQFSATTPAKATASGDTTNAVNHSSGTCAFGNGPDVVYRFRTRQDQKMTAKVTRATGSTIEPLIYLRRACEVEDATKEATCARHSSFVATMVVNNLPADEWYLVVDGLRVSSGAFNLEVTLDTADSAAPLNDSCIAASLLPLSGNNAQVQGTTVGAQNEASGTCAYSTGSVGDVVYSIDVPRPGMWLKATLTPQSTFAPALYVRSVCGSPFAGDELACVFNSTAGGVVRAVARNLSAGMHYVWVDGSTTTAANATGAFTLDVNLDYPSVPANDTCANAEPLAPNVPANGNTMDANPVYGPTLPASKCATYSVKGPDLVYSYQPASNGTFKVTVRPNGFDTVLWYSEGSCGLAACAGKADLGSAGVAETLTVTGKAGTTYYFFVDGYNENAYGPFTIVVEPVP